MLFYITFFYFIGVTLAQDNGTSSNTATPSFSVSALNCDQLSNTKLNPYVVIVLLKTSGRYVGMGSIIDTTTVLTALTILKAANEDPTLLKVLAGRFSPWWGSKSQVKNVREISVNVEGQLALLKTSKPFRYTTNVRAIRMALVNAPLKETYDEQYVVYGVPRSNYDIPGDTVTKATTYLRKLETLVTKGDDVLKCEKAFLKSNMYHDRHFCTYANFTFCWGVIGSPTVALRKGSDDVQIGVLTLAPIQESDIFQRHTKIHKYASWIKSLTFINYS